jgi:ABC transporter C-terminal domain
VSAEIIPLKAADPKLEKKIEDLEAQKAELEILMSAEGFYMKPVAETKKVQDQHAKVVADLAAMEEQWLQALAG